MPDSDYKRAVLAGIAHALMRLDSIEASRSPFNEDAAMTSEVCIRCRDVRASISPRVPRKVSFIDSNAMLSPLGDGGLTVAAKVATAHGRRLLL